MTRKCRAYLFTLALAPGALLVGCTPGEDKPPALEIEACRLFPFTEALAIAGDEGIGGTLSSTLQDGLGKSNPLECVYTDGASERPLILSLQVRPFASKKEAQGVFHSTEGRLGAFAGVEPVAVAGLGEKAVWGGGQLGQLHVLHNHLLLVFTCQGAADDATALASAKAMAEKVLPRIAELEKAAAQKKP